MRPIWTPSPKRAAAANLARFMACVNARQGLRMADYGDLYQWSIEKSAQFWTEVARFADVRASFDKDEPVIENPHALPGARFFPGARLNFAENLLRYRDAHPALISRNERGARSELSYRQLYAEVARVAAGLKSAGVVAGDRVAAFMPNAAETAIAMLATASIGAIWSSCSPDFGLGAVVDRFGQISPKVLFAADGYFYGGKSLDSLTLLAELLQKLPSVQALVLVAYSTAKPDLKRISVGEAKVEHWKDFGSSGAPLQFLQSPFDHPLYILYSSGTTGAPKCIVHGAGGTLLQHQKEHLLHTDVRREDRLFYFTTCGWMMWNWLLSALATGATLVLYDGSPLHPDAGALWRMASEERLTIFGTSAKYLASVEKSSFAPGRELDLSALRTILSTGSPLLPEGFDFVYRDVKADVQLSSISGGTDIVSCFALGCPIRPVHRGEIQCRGLGMRVEVFDEEGRSLRGERGELVCTAPFPSMPLGFWGDTDGSRYRAAYFERFPGVWHHADYAALTEHDGVIIYGRSDAVLNPGGVRIGTAEIYTAVEGLTEIAEALAVAQDWQGDVRIVLFVRLQSGYALDAVLDQKIRKTIRDRTTARHVPAKIIAVPDLPRTLSGKLTEIAVRNVIHGLPIGNRDALANPAALEHFRDLAELRS
jgi:acetoacetyl-CoA synthetase